MESFYSVLAVIFFSYLVGSFPTAIIISKMFYGFDIRDKGSGNMGSTNAFRVLGWKWGTVVQIVDILKGVIPVLFIATAFGTTYTFNSDPVENQTIYEIIAGVCSVLGHIFSIFVKFKGGKGISTAAGMLLAIVPVELGIGMIIFFTALFSSGYVSLGSMLGSLSIPFTLIIRYNYFGVEIPGYNVLVYFLSVLAVLLVLAHVSNIKRLLKGKENKFEKLQLIKFKKEK